RGGQIDFVRPLAHVGQDDDALAAHLHIARPDRKRVRGGAATQAQDPGFRRAKKWDVSRQHAELANLAGRGDLVGVAGVGLALGCDDLDPHCDSASSFLAFSRTSAMLPTRWNARSSVTSSSLPSRISLAPATDSATGTSLPARPVNCSATKNGCDMKRCSLRARETVSLSSSESSSMPRIAMMSCRSL